MSNIDWFKNDWCWNKVNGANFFNLSNRPSKTKEDVLVFSKGANLTFNPQRIYRTDGSLKRFPIGKENKSIDKKGSTVSHYGFVAKDDLVRERSKDGLKHPIDIIEFNIHRRGIKSHGSPFKHPTQKPLKLMEYLILTYTNKGDLILDNTAGSGTTGVAAQNLERQWIMIEMDEEDKYIKVIEDRMNMGRQGRMFL